MADIKILDDLLMKQIAKSPDAANWLILEEHNDFPGQWVVNSLDPGFAIDFQDLIGNYRTVTPNTLESFFNRATELQYEVAFGSDPEGIMEAYEHLNALPDVTLNSTLPGTIQGFLPFQLQGYNFLKDQDGIAMWSTGTGKTVLASALIKHHIHTEMFDSIWMVVKTHNKINTQRTLSRLADINSLILDGPQERRHKTLVSILEAPPGVVVITNYEKFRIDRVHLMPLFTGKRVLIIWDEMPTKLKSRDTQLYKSIRRLLYTGLKKVETRPDYLRQYMLSATPIENGPEDFYNCVRLIDPKLFGTVTEFRNEFVANYNPFNYEPAKWKNLDRMGLKAAHLVHQVDKKSPDIAKQFPKAIEEPYYIDWDKQDRAIYDLLALEAKRTLVDREIYDGGIFGLIAVMQMMCDAPSMVQNSASLREQFEIWGGDPIGSEMAYKLTKMLHKKLTDEKHTKLAMLKQLITEDHKDEKIVVFSSFNDALLPIIETHLDDWNVPFVRYNGTQKDKQIAQDYFQNEDFVRVFLSSDQGSDSISLEEASVVIHYDLPWKYSTYIQRQNRIHRVTTQHAAVRYYTLMMADSVEERKLKIIMKKKGYQEDIFGGGITDNSESSRMTREDLLYVLGI